MRENVELFSIEDDIVTYVTESDKVIKGVYNLDSDVVLHNIQIESADIFRNEKLFEDVANAKANNFIEKLFENNYPSAKNSFSSLLNSWELRLKFNKIKERLEEKTHRFSGTTKITSTPEFKKLQELTPNLVKFLKENSEAVTQVSEIKNAIKLANTVTQAFDYKKISYETLEEEKSYTSKNGVNESVYELICAQELIKKELLESKKSFDKIWASNDKIIRLGSMVYEEDTQKVLIKLGEAIKEVPYLALATKKQLHNVFTNAVGLNESASIASKDVQSFVTRIFEIKKPVRKELLKILNEKYGINVQNLKEPPTFKNLLNTQTVIFESLSKLITGDSAVKDILTATASMLKKKTGVESIDVNDYLNEVFVQAGLTEYISEGQLDPSHVNFARASKDIMKIADLLNMLSDELSDELGGNMQAEQPANGEDMQAEQPANGEDMYPSDETMPASPEDAEESGIPAMDPDSAAAAAEEEMSADPEGLLGGSEEEMPGEEVGEEPGEEMGAEEPEEDFEGVSPIDKDELTAQLKELEDLITDLAGALGNEEAPEEGFGEEEASEEEDVGVAVGGDAVDGEGADQDDDGDVDSEDLDALRSKKKKKKNPNNPF